MGTPIAMTGAPAVLSFIGIFGAPMPPPGVMPVEDICTVVPSLSALRAARASIAMMRSGDILSEIPQTALNESMPVS